LAQLPTTNFGRRAGEGAQNTLGRVIFFGERIKSHKSFFLKKMLQYVALSSSSSEGGHGGQAMPNNCSVYILLMEALSSKDENK
jgi:hypothetical protein